MPIRIDLSEAEWHTLRMLLHDYLPELRREVARTDALEYRHELVRRQEVCERLLDLLEQQEA